MWSWYDCSKKNEAELDSTTCLVLQEILYQSDFIQVFGIMIKIY